MIPFRATRLAVISIAALLGSVAGAADTTAPQTPVGSVTDTYHGITVSFFLWQMGEPGFQPAP